MRSHDTASKCEVSQCLWHDTPSSPLGLKFKSVRRMSSETYAVTIMAVTAVCISKAPSHTKITNENIGKLDRKEKIGLSKLRR